MRRPVIIGGLIVVAVIAALAVGKLLPTANEDVRVNETDAGDSTEQGSGTTVPAEGDQVPDPAGTTTGNDLINSDINVEVETSSAVEVSKIKSFEMTAKQWEFVPSTITVDRGDTVRLTITSTDVSHGFALPEFGVTRRLEPGTATTVEFVADKSGRFSFFCNVLCGSGHSSMRGVLVVN